MEDKINLLLSEISPLRLKRDINLGEYLPGKQKCLTSAFYLATSISELRQIIKLCREVKLPYLVFGTGSKIKFNPKCFEGVSIKNKSSIIKIASIKGKVSQKGLGLEEATIEADSGLTIEKLTAYLKEQGLAPNSQLAGFSGSMGGNIHLYQQDFLPVVKLQVLSVEDKTITKDLVDLLPSDIILTVLMKFSAKEEIRV